METKKTLFKTIALGAVLILTGIPGVAQSAPVTETFIAIIEEGPLEGQFGTGSFTYDDEDLAEDDIIGPAEGLEVLFTFDGQTFDETNDESYDVFPELVFEDATPVELNYVLLGGVNGVNFRNPILIELEMENDLFLCEDDDCGNYDYVTELEATVVPIPAAFWLLGTGLIGMLGFKRRFQR